MNIISTPYIILENHLDTAILITCGIGLIYCNFLAIQRKSSSSELIEAKKPWKVPAWSLGFIFIGIGIFEFFRK